MQNLKRNATKKRLVSLGIGFILRAGGLNNNKITGYAETVRHG